MFHPNAVPILGLEFGPKIQVLIQFIHPGCEIKDSKIFTFSKRAII